MLRFKLFLPLFFACSFAYAQVGWLQDYKMAQALSLKTGNFIVMDFWASWCGPCKVMDQELWQRPEAQKLSEQFIPLKVDIDRNRNLAISFRANTIPKVVIVDALGNIVWEKVGFSRAKDYLEILESLPSENAELIQRMLPLLSEGAKAEDYGLLAQAYQQLGKRQESFALQRSFLNISDGYYKQAIKLSSEPDEQLSAELHLLLNDAYRGKYKRALKKVEKIAFDEDEQLRELKMFIQAYCYKCDGKNKEFEALLEKINDQAYLTELQ